MAAAQALGPYDASELPRRISVPTLLTVGSADRVLPVEHTRALAALIPHATVTVLEGSGHQPFQEEPDRFNELALAFLLRAQADLELISA